MALRRKHWWILGGATVVLLALIAVLVTGSISQRTTTAASSSSSVSSSSSPANPSTTAPQPSSASPAPTSSPTAPPNPGKDLAAQKLAAMSLEQRVGQILMVSSPVTGADANSLYALDTLYVGNVFMKGRSTAGVAGIAEQVQAITGHISGDRTQGARPFVATDQEGGFVQIMRGPGFDDMPQAIEQGQLAPESLQADATRWGQQLASVGVNVNLAPVMDTVPSAEFAPQNAPIGAFGREYGYAPADVSSHGLAFARGMLAAGVAPTVKHFPGLGRVTLNTDVSAGVTDDITVRNDAYLQPFHDAVNAGVPWLMMSNAYYPKIDPTNLAPFSSVIVHDMVRGDLGFSGIIVSDDICDAVQVSGVAVDQRGVDFIAAGGTMALCTNQALLPQMYQGMVAAAQADPAFAAQVDSAALLVLEAKAARGLLN
ncbi:glycoside hydrolase family 3 N-terminal domain-containing protein [Arthrobacter sp. GMC3]|uniref:glycoside hydrolase family 3 N-terminal domain-containing protein n=1 Tax=Arthrobacter sp. GMC3 TaxID=2058894 RepID=UPI002157BC9C|nr:glycoside hydrolase family 3 N-terminal domain-containing protein [Arthrobacter sp. GMC3]